MEGIDSEANSLFKVKVNIKACPQTELTELTGLPKPSALILNSDDYAYVETLIDQETLNSVFKEGLLKQIGPLNRGVLWVSLWGLVESLKLPASAFVNIVAENLLFEDQEEIIDIILGFSSQAVWCYLPHNLVEQYSHLIVETIKQKLEVHPSKSLERKVFVFLYSEKDLFWAYEWSKHLGRAEKWRGIMQMCSILPLEEVKEILNFELAFDSSDMSLKFRNYCESAAVDNKQHTWDRILNTQELSLSNLEYLMKGFNQMNQKEILLPFSQKYFEELPRVFSSCEREYAEKFFHLLLPSYLDPYELIRNLELLELPQSWMQRMVVETTEALKKRKNCQELVTH